MPDPTDGDREGDASYRAPRTALSLEDFELEKRLGDGSYSQVVQARHKRKGKSYALKIIDKHLILRHKQMDGVRTERSVLDRLDYEGIVCLYFTFQDASSLYLGLELCPGGELFDQIRRRGPLAAADASFYAAEIVLILRYLKQEQVVHRDLKPENLLLTADGHLKLIDFGSAKDLRACTAQHEGRGSPLTGERASSFVGTADYVAPEMLRGEAVGCDADLWALGCVLFQMLTGAPPFRAASQYLTFQRIAAGDWARPRSAPDAAVDLLERLLELAPEDRLGAADPGLIPLMAHPFFKGLDWEGLRRGPAPPAVLPPRATPDAEAVDWELTSLAAELPLRYSHDHPSTARNEPGSPSNSCPAPTDSYYAPGHYSTGYGQHVVGHATHERGCGHPGSPHRHEGPHHNGLHHDEGLHHGGHVPEEPNVHHGQGHGHAPEDAGRAHHAVPQHKRGECHKGPDHHEGHHEGHSHGGEAEAEEEENDLIAGGVAAAATGPLSLEGETGGG